MNEVFCTQEKIRDIEKLIYFTKIQLKNGWLPPANILRMNDNFYVYDGHTRFLSFILSYKVNRAMCSNQSVNCYLSTCNIIDVSSDYTKTPEIKFGFVTPFDLDTEVRVSDFYSVKKYIIKHIEDTGDMSIIDKTSHLYKKKRTIRTMQDLANLYDFIVERITNEQDYDLAILS